MAAARRSRLSTDQRRGQLVALGIDIFSERPFDEVSIDDIAAAAGISKGLLYHYFPSKEAYFVATLEEKAAELQQRTIPDPDLPPLEQLSASLDAYLGWIEENAGSYDKMIRNAGAAPEVRALLDRVRTGEVDPMRLHFLDLDTALVQRALVDRELARSSGPHAENMLRDLAGRR